MARLKSFIFLVLVLYLVLGAFVDNHILNCKGPEIVASGVYAAKIKMARGLFTKSINFLEPEYDVKITQCYNAWADWTNTNKAKVIVSEPLVRDFSTEELAGELGHELAHLQAHAQKEYPEHWKIDVMGAELTSKDIMLSKLNRMIREYDNLFEKNKLLMYVFPLSYLNYTRIRSEFVFRVDKVNNYFK